MSWTLFKANIRGIRTIWILMTAVYIGYFAVVLSMYDPQSTQAIEQMLEMLPEGLLKAFGMERVGDTLLSFLTIYMYGILLFLFPMVISTVVNHRLIAAHVDRGSRAYLLSTPNSRKKIVATQALFSLASITMFFAVITICALGLSEIMLPGEMETGDFILVNVYSLLMYYAIGGIGFLASCIANESKVSLGLGIGVPLTYLELQMIGDVGDKFSWLGKLSLYYLFQPEQLIEGASFAYVSMAVFVALAAVLYAAGIAMFNKRDLYL